MPIRSRRITRAATLTLIATALALPFPAVAQELRARDLSVVEDLLSSGIQEAIQVTVQLINTENLEAQQISREAGEVPEMRYMVRSSGETQARGIFLEDYGAIFTVQVPNLAYLNSSMFAITGYQDGELTVINPRAGNALVSGALVEEMSRRAQLSRMRAEIDAFTGELEAQGSSEKAEELRASIAELQRTFKNYSADTESVATARERSVDRRDSEPAGGSDTLERWPGIRVMSSATPEALARAEALAIQQKNQLESAVIASVVDTLASYGRVIRGLDDDDRLAVVLLPSSYLSRVRSWARATQRDEEFIISVSFRDVQRLDKGDITDQEFGQRIRVESRLGQAKR